MAFGTTPTLDPECGKFRPLRLTLYQGPVQHRAGAVGTTPTARAEVEPLAEGL